ncbi:MAG: hypothetical protein ACE5FI_00780 [Anaerolineales bacterium]
MKIKRLVAFLFLPLVITAIACVCTSALPFGGGAPDINATVEAGTGTDIEGLQATAEAIGGQLQSEEGEATAEAGIATAESVVEGITAPENVELLAPFPVPPNVESVLLNEEEQTLLTVNLTQDELIEFYRTELTAMGLTERPITTVINEGTFSIVFDGWSDGRSVVVQGTSFGDTFSVSIRLESV